MMGKRLLLILAVAIALLTSSTLRAGLFDSWDDPLDLPQEPYSGAFDETFNEFGESFQRPWSFRFSILFMDRDRPDSLLLVNNKSQPSENVNAIDLHLGGMSGAEFSTIYRLERNEAIELRIMSVEDVRGVVDLFTSQPGINSNLVLPMPTVDHVMSFYNSQVHSFELNGRQRQDDDSILITGLRYIELDELFMAEFRSGGAGAMPQNTYSTTARNRLYGLQVGGESIWWTRGAFTADGIAKFGLFGNATAQSSRLSGTSSVAQGDARRLTLMAELGLNLNVQLTDTFTLRAGYQCLWIGGLSLATDQMPTLNFSTGTGLESGGHVLYQGVGIGVEILH